jgi:hypothetical protein
MCRVSWCRSSKAGSFDAGKNGVSMATAGRNSPFRGRELRGDMAGDRIDRNPAGHLSAVVTAPGPVQYQWVRSYNDEFSLIEDNDNITGTTTPTLAIRSIGWPVPRSPACSTGASGAS